jgi:hypothetical protein
VKLVTSPGWSVSCTTGTGISGAILSVYRYFPQMRNSLGGHGRSVPGDHHGRVFPSSAAANAFALKHGYLQEFRTAWCRSCRTLHKMSTGRKSGFCPVQKEFL